MVHALLVFAAEEAETSKVPFYIAGGLLTLWAIGLSAIGLSRADFPSEGGAARGVMGISAVLVLATMVAVLLTA